MIKEILAAIEREDDFLVATHVNPDGDAIGALLAVGILLDKLGKKRTLAVVDKDDIAPQYRWLPGIESISPPNGASGRATIVLDAANKSRLGALGAAFDKSEVTINIDHHIDNPGFASLNWLEEKTSSTAEMIYDLWRQTGLPLPKEAAVCIYVGMLTDTGRWQYANTGAETLKKASLLLEAGVEPIEVYKRIYENNSVEWIKLLALGLGKAVFDKELGLAYAFITQADLKATGAAMSETENLVERLRSVAGINVAMILKETRQGDLKVSLRSREPLDVGGLARTFGGGGHKYASGFTTKDKPENVIENVKKWLTESS